MSSGSSSSMKPVCDLEVNVNNEHTFFLDKKRLFSYCGKLISKLSRGPVTKLDSYKVVLHDFPGGVRAFELVSRFCYMGHVDMKPSNILLLHCAAVYLEMNEKVRPGNLVWRTEQFLREYMAFMNWSELLSTVRDCETMLPTSDACGLLAKLIDAIVVRINNTRFADSDNISPVASSPESFGFRYSSDTRSSDRCYKAAKIGWWFEDLALLGIGMIERVVKVMIVQNMDNALIGKFLLYYLKSILPALGLSSISPKKNEKCGQNPRLQKEALETVVNLLKLLDRAAVPCKNLFVLLRTATVLNVSAFARKQLEEMIGSQLDQATLDNILLPAPPAVGWMYDVDMVMRLVQAFIKEHDLRIESDSFRKVQNLLDNYIMEVSPDVNLNPSKFHQLLQIFPDEARDSCDVLYRALDMYLESHPKISAEEEVKLCKSVNYQKLSFEASKHVSQNPRFPTSVAIHVLLLQQANLKNALHEYNHKESSLSQTSTSDTGTDSTPELEDPKNRDSFTSYELDNNPYLSMENSDLKADILGMQWRVMELEKACQKLHSQFTKIAKLKRRSCTTNRLPRLCS